MVDVMVWGRRTESVTRSILMACEEKQITCELVEPARDDERLRKYSPLGRTPVMLHADTALYDAHAIGVYLEAEFGGKTLSPTGALQQARMHQWMSVTGGALYEHLILRWLAPRAGLTSLSETEIAKAQPRAIAILERAEADLESSRFLVGDQLSLADLWLYPSLFHLTADRDGIELLAKLPNLTRFIEEMERRPSAALTRPFGGPFGSAALHLPLSTLEPAFLGLPAAPTDRGRVAMLVSRRESGIRDAPARVYLTPAGGMPGDAWGRTKANQPEAQLTVIRSDVATLLANGQPLTLFGDNLLVELDLSRENLPTGTRLRCGEALLEVTPKPHTGCVKFRGRFGHDALRLTADQRFRDLRLRGLYMRVLEPGNVEVGSPIEVLSRA